MASLCTGKVIRGYFLHGQLPPNGLVCPTSENLFPEKGIGADVLPWMAEVVDAEDKRLLQDLKALGEDIQPFLTRMWRSV